MQCVLEICGFLVFIPSLDWVLKHLTVGSGVLMAVIKPCNNVIKPEKTKRCKWEIGWRVYPVISQLGEKWRGQCVWTEMRNKTRGSRRLKRLEQEKGERVEVTGPQRGRICRVPWLQPIGFNFTWQHRPLIWGRLGVIELGGKRGGGFNDQLAVQYLKSNCNDKVFFFFVPALFLTCAIRCSHLAHFKIFFKCNSDFGQMYIIYILDFYLLQMPVYLILRLIRAD